jgi:RNA polymerase subunit RPABC4/transcription elongation factor Spt4
MSDSLGISVQAMCYQCQALTELCPDCQEQRDTRDAVLAHQIVDESEDYIIIGYGVRKRTVANGGAVSEYNPMSVIRDLPSGHDWTEREDEFLEPISLIIDRLFDIETSVTVTANETVCQNCHYLHNKAIACPNCN